jgi:hypothetical protein
MPDKDTRVSTRCTGPFPVALCFDCDTVQITTKYMTKYERARVLGARALQIRCVPHPPPHPHLLRLLCALAPRISHRRPRVMAA